jgi:cytidylate kinase
VTTPLVVAIDGPSGSGKSSTSRGVADRLRLDYLDTGAMYRAMTWALLQKGAVSLVAAVPRVREQLVELQRAIIGRSDGIVVEGRDIGSTVVPDAPVKIYLVADPAARAARRAAETGAVDTVAMEAALARRDQIDSTRAASPLAQAAGAVLVDGTHLTLDEVIASIVEIVESAG